MTRVLLTGATGFVGSHLADRLIADGDSVRAMVRDAGAGRSQPLREKGCELHEGDVLDAATLRGAGEGIDVAYYLVHSMGRGGDGSFAERERRAARQFATMAREEGVGRVIYLGGLGDRPESEHLRSRQETAEQLGEHGPPLTYFRASMVVGAESESYRTLRYLVERLPAMIAPAWLKNETQPIAMDDTLDFLAQACRIDATTGREIQIGGPDRLSYGDMLDCMSDALGVRKRPRIPVPFITASLSSHWIGLVTPVDAGVARPLVESLAVPTVVTDPSGMELFDLVPIGFEEALRRAVAQDPEVASRR